MIMIDPWLCELPHAVSHREKLEYLVRQFTIYGWDLDKPALVGYWMKDHVQLLSGTHRCVAARRAGILVPIVLHDEAAVRDSWGDLDKWFKIMISGAVRYDSQRTD